MTENKKRMPLFSQRLERSRIITWLRRQEKDACSTVASDLEAGVDIEDTQDLRDYNGSMRPALAAEALRSWAQYEELTPQEREQLEAMATRLAPLQRFDVPRSGRSSGRWPNPSSVWFQIPDAIQLHNLLTHIDELQTSGRKSTRFTDPMARRIQSYLLRRLERALRHEKILSTSEENHGSKEEDPNA